MKRKLALVGIGIFSAISFLTATPASAAPPACSSGFYEVLTHYVSPQVRSKACFKPSTENFQFQDTYADGWSALWSRTQDDLSGNKYMEDRNGANNGWITDYGSFPEGSQVFDTLCAYDYSAGLSHGCSGFYVWA